MFSRNLSAKTLVLCALFLPAGRLCAQATFSVAASSTTGTDIGATELTGQLYLTINSGISVAAPMLITYSAPITNGSASEISVVGTGGLAAITVSPVLDRSENTIRIDVPAGGNLSDQILISGVRVALAGLGLTSVSTTITAPSANGNAVLAGQRTVEVISSVLNPFTIRFDEDPLEIDNHVDTSASTSFTLVEGYPSAFSSAVGSYGQTVPTRIRFNPFPSIPSGVTVTFPQTVTCAKTGATFTTLSNANETVPRTDGTTSVVYKFTGAAASYLSKESFPFNITATIAAQSGTGTITFQATLLPLGIATPNDDNPSTDIPRYTERGVPDEVDLVTGTTQLAFPFLSQNYIGNYTGIALTNPIPYRVKVDLAAYDEAGNLVAGAGITNPVSLILPRSGQFAKLANEIFGSSFNATTSGTITVTGFTRAMTGFYLEGGTISGEGLDGAIGDIVTTKSWVWPTVYHQGESATTILRLYNPGPDPADAALKLYDDSGALVATSNITVAAAGTRILDAKSAFSGIDLDSIAGGYLTGSSTAALAVSESFGNRLDSNVLSGQLAVQRTQFLVPHFVTGAGYSTELEFVNLDPSMTGRLTLTLLDNSGTSIGGGPVQVSVASRERKIQTIDQLFPNLGESFTTGYIQIDLEKSYQGPFGTTTPIVGSVRFTAADGLGSTALPLFAPASLSFVYSHVAQDLGYFSGVAIINANSKKATVTLEVVAADGTLVGSTTFELQPGNKIAKLLDELVPSSAGQLGGYVRIQSTLPVVSFSIFGTTDGKSLSAIPPQNVAQ